MKEEFYKVKDNGDIGMSYLCKREINSIKNNLNVNEIIIIDPENEYERLVNISKGKI